MLPFTYVLATFGNPLFRELAILVPLFYLANVGIAYRLNQVFYSGYRLRHAYGELGNVGAGQYWSPFMDIDIFPNSLEYWGPTGMVFFRNVQLRWMPIRTSTRQVTLAIERPGASSLA